MKWGQTFDNYTFTVLIIAIVQDYIRMEHDWLAEFVTVVHVAVLTAHRSPCALPHLPTVASGESVWEKN